VISERWGRVGLLGSEEAKTDDFAYGKGQRLETLFTAKAKAGAFAYGGGQKLELSLTAEGKSWSFRLRQRAKAGAFAYGRGQKLELSLTINRLAASGGLSRPVSFVPSATPGPTLSAKTDG
jgi:hypothetical protein